MEFRSSRRYGGHGGPAIADFRGMGKGVSLGRVSEFPKTDAVRPGSPRPARAGSARRC